MGNNLFTTIPSWHMDKVSLHNVKTIKYLGSEFGDLNGQAHLNNRSVASKRAFYTIQTAGVKYPDLNINVVSDIYKTAVESVLQFGCSSIYLNKGNISKLNQLQGKLIKKCLGLGQWCRTCPLLKTMDITPMSLRVGIGNLDSLRRCLLNDSISQKFYTDLLFYLENDQQHSCSKTLVSRALFYAKEYNIDLKRYIFSDKYQAVTKHKLLEEYYMKNGQNGLVDSLRNLLNHHCPNNRYFVELLLKTFKMIKI